MIGDLSRVQKIYLVTGRTDMRKSFDGLMAVIRDNFQMDPFSNAVFLFCGRKKNTMKALYFDRDGFVLLQKRLDNGKFQWPRNASEVRPLTRQEFRWLMEGLSIDQPKAIQPAKDRDYWFVQYVDFEKFFYSRSRLLTEDIHRCEIMGCVVRG